MLEKRLRESPGGAPYALGTSSAVTTIACSEATWARSGSLRQKSEHVDAISGMSCRAIRQRKSVVIIGCLSIPANHYKIVISAKANPWRRTCVATSESMDTSARLQNHAGDLFGKTRITVVPR